jgi:hypothetical protein
LQRFAQESYFQEPYPSKQIISIISDIFCFILFFNLFTAR